MSVWQAEMDMLDDEVSEFLNPMPMLSTESMEMRSRRCIKWLQPDSLQFCRACGNR